MGLQCSDMNISSAGMVYGLGDFLSSTIVRVQVLSIHRDCSHLLERERTCKNICFGGEIVENKNPPRKLVREYRIRDCTYGTE